MTQFATSDYTPEQQIEFLKADSRVVEFRYEIFDGLTGTSKGFFDDILEGGSISYSYESSIRRSGSLTIAENLVDDITRINFLRDQIQIYIVFQVYDAVLARQELVYPAGRYVLSSGSRTAQDGVVTRSVTLYDLAKRLSDDTLISRVEAPSGTNVISFLTSYLEALGFTRLRLQASSKTVPATRSWEPGTSKLTFINELLSLIGRGSLYFDAEGYACSDDYVDPSERDVTITHYTDDQSVLTPKYDEELDLGSVPNRWVFVASQPDQTSMTAIFTNSDPNSPTSTVNRGFTLTFFSSSNNEAASQAALNDLAKKKAIEDSQIYQTVNIETLLLPYHAEAEIVELFHEDGMTEAATFQEISWSYNLQADSVMSHSLRRIFPVELV